MTTEFTPWPKTPRLASGYTITEKIDGTNAAVRITALPDDTAIPSYLTLPNGSTVWRLTTGQAFVVTAQSRKRIISPEDDNFGFANWVHDNGISLISDLGEGLHFGEWWGRGIQRGYGRSDRHFSLFNVPRYAKSLDLALSDMALVGHGFTTPGLSVVPLLDWADTDTSLREIAHAGEAALAYLRNTGSRIHQDDGLRFPRPEGIVLHHTRSNQLFKDYVPGGKH